MRDFPEASLASCKVMNRKALRVVDRWLDEELLSNSVFRYGIPDELAELVNSPLDDYTTYTDMLACLGQSFPKPVRYLEIGVSVGKNLWQLAHAWRDAELDGIDVEHLNPAVRRRLDWQGREAWPGKSGGLRPDAYTELYRLDNNSIRYHCMDEFDEEGWRRLSGRQFNVVFSDACHHPDALLFEWQMLCQYELLDLDGFVMMWDDLGGDMRTAFLQIVSEAAQTWPDTTWAEYRTNGWVNRRTHAIGLLSFRCPWMQSLK